MARVPTACAFPQKSPLTLAMIAPAPNNPRNGRYTVRSAPKISIFSIFPAKGGESHQTRGNVGVEEPTRGESMDILDEEEA